MIWIEVVPFVVDCEDPSTVGLVLGLQILTLHQLLILGIWILLKNLRVHKLSKLDVD